MLAPVLLVPDPLDPLPDDAVPDDAVPDDAVPLEAAPLEDPLVIAGQARAVSAASCFFAVSRFCSSVESCCFAFVSCV